MEKQFPEFQQIAQNSAETVPFHKISTPGNLVKFWYFTQSKEWHFKVIQHQNGGHSECEGLCYLNKEPHFINPSRSLWQMHYGIRKSQNFWIF